MPAEQWQSGTESDRIAPLAVQGEVERTTVAYKISEQRDVPLLLQVRNSTFISHDQLMEYALESGLEKSRRSFNWRMNRFLDGRLVTSVGRVLPYTGQVYTITRQGLSLLETFGEGLVSISSGSETLANRLQAPHFLELIEIRRSFLKAGVLQHWQPDRVLSSLNYVLGSPLAKDYDALAEIHWATKSLRIAVEYERTLKTSARYQEIAKGIRDEDQVSAIMYLTPTPDLVFTLSAEFKRPELPMMFTASRRFRASGLATSVMFCYGTMRQSMSVQEALEVIAGVAE